MPAWVVRDQNGRRAVFGENENFQSDPQWRNLVPFDEYFDGDTGQRLSMIPYLLRPNFVVP
ncbi:hypothetical protein [Mycobacterium sp.]|uniref:hypothetical protein n=1 Tax=Mycobacterium sp. TaxID=1785 RepID=UPI002CD35BDB|nr:hypothetical protein [Mycobacterium sp.]HTH87388.1 hypothetical protein [Mycobacterium sp.]